MEKDLRRQGIGGSEIGAIMGLSRFASPLDVWRAKMGLAADIYTPAMEWGNRLESPILTKYGEETGRRVDFIPTRKIENEPFIYSPDGVVLDGGKISRIVEIKTARTAEGWGGDSKVPAPYRAQVNWYMGFTGAAAADIAVLIGGSDFRIFKMEFDEFLFKAQKKTARDFWDNYVLTKTPPPVSTLEDIKNAPRVKGVEIEATPEIMKKIKNIMELREEIKTLEDEEQKLRVQVVAAMGDASILKAGGKKLASFVFTSRESIDTKKLIQEMPEIYERFLRKTEYKTFRISGAGNE